MRYFNLLFCCKSDVAFSEDLLPVAVAAELLRQMEKHPTILGARQMFDALVPSGFCF